MLSVHVFNFLLFPGSTFRAWTKVELVNELTTDIIVQLENFGFVYYRSRRIMKTVRGSQSQTPPTTPLANSMVRQFAYSLKRCQ